MHDPITQAALDRTRASIESRPWTTADDLERFDSMTDDESVTRRCSSCDVTIYVHRDSDAAHDEITCDDCIGDESNARAIDAEG